MSIEKIVADSLDDFWKYYEAGEFATGMATLSTFGISPDVIDFTFNPDSYYIPNRRGDSFITPTGTPEDSIPVIGLTDNDKHHFRTPTVHRLQRIALANAGIDPAIVSKKFMHASDEISASSGSPGTGRVVHRRLRLSNSAVAVDSSPTILLNVEYEKGELVNTCAGVILHELVHVAQCLNSPAIEGDIRLQKELEAYAVQACLLHSYLVPYSYGTMKAAEVNVFRIRNLGKNEYEPTPEFSAALMQDESLRKIVK